MCLRIHYVVITSLLRVPTERSTFVLISPAPFQEPLQCLSHCVIHERYTAISPSALDPCIDTVSVSEGTWSACTAIIRNQPWSSCMEQRGIFTERKKKDFSVFKKCLSHVKRDARVELVSNVLTKDLPRSITRGFVSGNICGGCLLQTKRVSTSCHEPLPPQTLQGHHQSLRFHSSNSQARSYRSLGKKW